MDEPSAPWWGAIGIAIGGLGKAAVDFFGVGRKDNLDQLQLALARVDKLEERGDRQATQIGALKAASAVAEQKITALEADIAQYRAKIMALETDISDLLAQIEHLSGTIPQRGSDGRFLKRGAR